MASRYAMVEPTSTLPLLAWLPAAWVRRLPATPHAGDLGAFVGWSVVHMRTTMTRVTRDSPGNKL